MSADTLNNMYAEEEKEVAEEKEEEEKELVKKEQLGMPENQNNSQLVIMLITDNAESRHCLSCTVQLVCHDF